MRLTLRALLNWINGNLSPEDAQIIEQKVADSELARNLKRQIEEVMALEQLPAPTMLDGTPLGNPNSAAEYLDNVMSSEQTPEYEKFCLHSEIVLGEIAACHKILSIVLGGDVEVSPELKAKMYNLYNLYNQEATAFSRMAEEDNGIDFSIIGAEEPTRKLNPWLLGGVVGGAVVVILLIVLPFMMKSDGKKDSKPSLVPPAPTVTLEIQNPAPAPTVTDEEDGGEGEDREDVENIEDAEDAEDVETGKTTTPAVVPEVPAVPAVKTPADTKNSEESEEPEDLGETEDLEEPVVAPAMEALPEGAIGRVNVVQDQIFLTLPEGAKQWRPLTVSEPFPMGQALATTYGFQSSYTLWNALTVTVQGESVSEFNTFEESEDLSVEPEYGKFLYEMSPTSDLPHEIYLQVFARTSVRLEPGTKLALEISCVPSSTEAPYEEAVLYLLEGKMELSFLNEAGEYENEVTVDAESSANLCRGAMIRILSTDTELPKTQELESIPSWALLRAVRAANVPVELRAEMVKVAPGKDLMERLSELASGKDRVLQSQARRILCQQCDEKTLQVLGKSSKKSDRALLLRTLNLSSRHAESVQRAVGSGVVQALLKEKK